MDVEGLGKDKNGVRLGNDYDKGGETFGKELLRRLVRD